MNVSLKQVGAKFRLINSATGGTLHQMGPRKLSKDRAEYRQALLNGEEPYDYTNDPVSEETNAAVQSSIDTYVTSQQKTITSQSNIITTEQGKIETEEANIQTANETYEATVAELDAQLEAGTITQEEHDAAVAEALNTRNTAVTNAQTNIDASRSKIATAQSKIDVANDNIEHAADNITSITISEIPEVLTIDNPNPKCKVTVKGDFSANESTVVESTEKMDKDVQIQNTGEPADVVIDLGNSNANLAGQWDEVTVKSVAENSMTVAVGAHINKLIVKRGRVVVKNAYVSDNVDEVVVENGAVVVANNEIIASKMGDFYNNPAIIHVNNPLSFSRITSGILTMGHFVYNNNARVDFTTATGTAAGFMLRGAGLLADFKGEGEWHSANNPCIWLSDFDGKIRIYSGKFFNDANTNECIYAEKGFIEIYGGEFHNVKEEGKKDFLINCLDANYKSGKAGITVYGGKFYGFDPAHNEVEGENTNFVAEGYESIYHEDGDYYEVVPVDNGESSNEDSE